MFVERLWRRVKNEDFTYGTAQIPGAISEHVSKIDHGMTCGRSNPRPITLGQPSLVSLHMRSAKYKAPGGRCMLYRLKLGIAC